MTMCSELFFRMNVWYVLVAMTLIQFRAYIKQKYFYQIYTLQLFACHKMAMDRDACQKRKNQINPNDASDQPLGAAEAMVSDGKQAPPQQIARVSGNQDRRPILLQLWLLCCHASLYD